MDDVAPFGLISNDHRFDETLRLRLLGKEEESALKVEALGCLETLAVVTRIHSIIHLKRQPSGAAMSSTYASGAANGVY